jgi:chromate reductase
MRLVLLAGSVRRDSVNVALAETIAAAARRRGHEAERIDLADHPLPLFNADDEAEHGVHPSAHSLVAALDGADAVVLVSPEYNGGFTPLLKNALDWATRVEKRVWARTPVGLACATPGGSGGRRGLALLRTLLESITVDVVAPQLSVPEVADAISPDGRLTRPADDAALDALLDALEAAVATDADVAA